MEVLKEGRATRTTIDGTGGSGGRQPGDGMIGFVQLAALPSLRLPTMVGVIFIIIVVMCQISDVSVVTTTFIIYYLSSPFRLSVAVLLLSIIYFLLVNYPTYLGYRYSNAPLAYRHHE